MYITAAPVALAIAAVLPDGLNLQLAGASGVIFLPLSYFMGQVAADFGNRLEPKLWDSWGGPPTTRFLQHGNEEFNPVTRALVHAKLRSFGLAIPTAAEEKADDDLGRQLYGSAVDYLRNLTRDPNRFHLVLKANTEYGFRRNLLGLKPIGLAVTIIALAVSGWSLYFGWHTDGAIASVASVITLLNACVALGWLIGVRSATVRIAADRYARILLEASINVEPRN